MLGSSSSAGTMALPKAKRPPVKRVGLGVGAGAGAGVVAAVLGPPPALVGVGSVRPVVKGVYQSSSARVERAAAEEETEEEAPVGGVGLAGVVTAGAGRTGVASTGAGLVCEDSAVFRAALAARRAATAASKLALTAAGVVRDAVGDTSRADAARPRSWRPPPMRPLEVLPVPCLGDLRGGPKALAPTVRDSAARAALCAAVLRALSASS